MPTSLSRPPARSLTTTRRRTQEEQLRRSRRYGRPRLLRNTTNPPAPMRPDPNVRHEIQLNGAPTLGPEEAKVTIVEFSDFQCPFCAQTSPTLKQIHEAYPDQVRIVFKHFPLPTSRQPQPAVASCPASISPRRRTRNRPRYRPPSVGGRCPGARSGSSEIRLRRTYVQWRPTQRGWLLCTCTGRFDGNLRDPCRVRRASFLRITLVCRSRCENDCSREQRRRCGR